MAVWGEKKQETPQRWRMTGRSDGGWGTPSRGWDRTALRTSNVCHSRKLMMPRSWANHPPAACEKRGRQSARTVAGTWIQSEEVRRSRGVRRGWGVSVKVQEYLWQSTPHMAPLSDFEMNESFFLSQSNRRLLPSSASVIESSYLLRFMRNSANFISSHSLHGYLIFHSEKGGWGVGVFGCSAEIFIISSQLGSSNLGDKGEMEEGWGLRSGKMLRRDNRIRSQEM